MELSRNEDERLKSLRKRFVGSRINIRVDLTEEMALTIEDHCVMITHIEYNADQYGFVTLSVACHSSLIYQPRTRKWLQRMVDIITTYYNLKVVCKTYHYNLFVKTIIPTTTDYIYTRQMRLADSSTGITIANTTFDSTAGKLYLLLNGEQNQGDQKAQ